MSVTDNPRPRGPIQPTKVRWRANGTTPPVMLQRMPDRVPPARGWIEVAALIVFLLIAGIIGAGLWGRI
jgi:hypothetical protein